MAAGAMVICQWKADDREAAMVFRLNWVGAAVVGILAFVQQPAFAASSLLGTIAEVFRFPAVLPLPVFETVKPAILPGAPIFGLPDRSDGAAIDAGRIRTCRIPDPAPPFKRATEGFAKRFVAAANRDELRSLFGLSEQEARDIDSYEVRLRNAVSLTAPSDAVEKNFTSAMQDKSCVGAQSALPRIVVRVIIADLDVELRGRQSLPAGIADKLRAAGAQDLSSSGDRAIVRFALPGRLLSLSVR